MRLFELLVSTVCMNYRETQEQEKQTSVGIPVTTIVMMSVVSRKTVPIARRRGPWAEPIPNGLRGAM